MDTTLQDKLSQLPASRNKKIDDRAELLMEEDMDKLIPTESIKLTKEESEAFIELIERVAPSNDALRELMGTTVPWDIQEDDDGNTPRQT